jgi:menaquinone-dependent protoporphyrinogen oxidase
MRVQIVYGSKRGGTAGLAHMIATAFERAGWTTQVDDVVNRPGIGDVDVVVVGGALFMNHWPRSLRRWARHHTPTLRAVPVWFFSSGPLDDSAREGDIAPTNDVGRLAADVEISGFMTFGGYLDAHPSGFIARSMARKSAGDWRDSEQVAEWVQYIVSRTVVAADVPAQRTGEDASIDSLLEQGQQG